MGRDKLSLDVSDLTASQVAELIALKRRFETSNFAKAVETDDESWRDAVSTGWTIELVEMLRDHLRERGADVQLLAFDRAIQNGGFISREEVYELGGYPETRRLNNWTAPINRFSEWLTENEGLPEDAAWPIETQYGPGTGFRPAIGFTVPAEIVLLVRG